VVSACKIAWSLYCDHLHARFSIWISSAQMMWSIVVCRVSLRQVGGVAMEVSARARSQRATAKTKTFSFRAEKCCFPYCYYCVILVLLVLFRVSNSQWFGFWVF